MPNCSSNIYLPHLDHYCVSFTARVLGGEGVEMSSWLDGHSFSGAHHYHYFLCWYAQAKCCSSVGCARLELALFLPIYHSALVILLSRWTLGRDCINSCIAVLRRGSFVADVSFSKPTVAAAKVIGSTVFCFQAHGAPFASTRQLLLSRLKMEDTCVEGLLPVVNNCSVKALVVADQVHFWCCTGLSFFCLWL